MGKKIERAISILHNWRWGYRTENLPFSGRYSQEEKDLNAKTITITMIMTIGGGRL